MLIWEKVHGHSWSAQKLWDITVCQNLCVHMSYFCRPGHNLSLAAITLCSQDYPQCRTTGHFSWILTLQAKKVPETKVWGQIKIHRWATTHSKPVPGYNITRFLNRSLPCTSNLLIWTISNFRLQNVGDYAKAEYWVPTSCRLMTVENLYFWNIRLWPSKLIELDVCGRFHFKDRITIMCM